MSNKKNSTKKPPAIKNKKARHEFKIGETFEAGLVLKGTEVKSLRDGKASLNEAFAYMKDGELYLKNMYIKRYEQGSWANHDERRERKLLLKRRELNEIDKLVSQKGKTVVPLKLYFKNGYAKLLIGMAEGKKKYDKREDIKEKDLKREIDRKIKGSHKIKL